MAQQQVDFLSTRLKHPQAQLNTQYVAVNALAQRLIRKLPRTQLLRNKQATQQLTARLNLAIEQRLQLAQQGLRQQMRTLSAVGPLSTLERGYSITTKNDHVVLQSDQVKKGDEVVVQLHQGILHCEVKDVAP
jgi:exodeoxyribonuclease VII large subunit